MDWLKLIRGQRAKTQDKEAPEVFTIAGLGKKQQRTPEGFLLCLDVPIARTGTMMYGPGQVPIKPGPDGISYVTRDAQALFDPKTIASYQGKPVVNEHPDDDVNPDNWKKLAVGITLNPRVGTGDDADLMLADLLITDRNAIQDVLAGKREVSAGYEADYQQTGVGEGRQTNIIANHVALVSRGRCGPRCSIGDQDSMEGKMMAGKSTTRRRAVLSEAVRSAFRDAGEELASSLAQDPMFGGGDSDPPGDDDDNHIHIHLGDQPGGKSVPSTDDPTGGAGGDPIEARFQSLEQGHAELKQMLQQIMAKVGGGEAPPAAPADGGQPPAGTKDENELPAGAEDPLKAKTGDSAALSTGFQKLLADAEVLVPGFRTPTFDSALPRAKTIDQMCQIRRRVLSHLSSTADGVRLLASAGGDSITDQTSCEDVAAIFGAAAAARRVLNNAAMTKDSGQPPTGAGSQGPRRAMTPAEINKANAAYWAGR